ncbi:hypothetical protein [Agriterribacter sp.]|uniref:hypothetical protein n=1 Tax=Agriterribacter sp. TaxID=2821509 RepID=UPI002C710444|nr:hypothetical protein [Agriterribacter sp.]HRP57167.1 hypothetical protein [Agriterribacter sp.]
MKRYLLSIAAALVAIGTVAFNTPEKEYAMHVFEFDSSNPGGYSKANVENISKTYWKYVPGASLCGGSIKACRIQVSDAYVDNPLNPTALKSTFSITAQESSPGIAYVQSIPGTPTNQISNQP